MFSKYDEFKRQNVDGAELESNIGLSDKFYASFIRKMLEICQKDNYLVVNAEAERNVLGFVSKYEEKENDLVIRFNGFANWKITVGQEEILCNKRGNYFISESEEQKQYEEKLKGISGLNVPRIVSIIKVLGKAEHGAILIIAKDARSESNRLCKKYNRGTVVKKVGIKNSDEQFIKDMSSVDGAVFVDLQGKCTAFGVILDGRAKIEGENDRGSRYNSSKNYVAKTNRIAVVVSEDKERGINILKGWEL